MNAYEASGKKGTLLWLADGRFADTVTGETSEAQPAHVALEHLRRGASFVAQPFYGWTVEQVDAYVGA